MATEKQYQDRAAEIEAAWQTFKPVGSGWSYITDACVDMENASFCEQNTPEFWDAMLTSLDMAAAQRLEDMGISWKAFPIKLNY